MLKSSGALLLSDYQIKTRYSSPTAQLLTSLSKDNFTGTETTTNWKKGPALLCEAAWSIRTWTTTFFSFRMPSKLRDTADW